MFVKFDSFYISLPNIPHQLSNYKTQASLTVLPFNIDRQTIQVYYPSSVWGNRCCLFKSCCVTSIENLFPLFYHYYYFLSSLYQSVHNEIPENTKVLKQSTLIPSTVADLREAPPFKNSSSSYEILTLLCGLTSINSIPARILIF